MARASVAAPATPVAPATHLEHDLEDTSMLATKSSDDLEDASMAAKIRSLQAKLAVEEARAAVAEAKSTMAATLLERYSCRN